MPVQILWGDHDRILPVGYAAQFAQLLPQARVDIIEDCGHLPQSEKPQEFLRRFREFTASVTKGKKP